MGPARVDRRPGQDRPRRLDPPRRVRGPEVQADYTVDDQWELARWAEEHGLAAEALAHDTAVTRIDPTARRPGRSWVQELRGAMDDPRPDRGPPARPRGPGEGRQALDRPLLENWKDWPTPSKAEAEAALLGVIDPRAVRSIGRVFAPIGPKEQNRAVRLLGQIDSTEASKVLAQLGVFGDSEEVRRFAIETLRRRDLRGALDPVIRLIREPIRFRARPNAGPDAPAVLIEGKEANLRGSTPRTSGRSPNARRRWPGPPDPRPGDRGRQPQVRRRHPRAGSTGTSSRSAEQRVGPDRLHGITGKDYGPDRAAWMSWWTDRQGYALQVRRPIDRPPGPTLQVVDTYPSRRIPASPPARRSRPSTARGRSRPSGSATGS